MEWFEKVKEFITGFPQLLQTSPRYGYLIVAAILLLWLLGIICGWLGVILAVGIGLALLLFSISGK